MPHPPLPPAMDSHLGGDPGWPDLTVVRSTLSGSCGVRRWGFLQGVSLPTGVLF